MILFKKLWRTIGKYKAQFISMILMIALGIGVFLGFNMEWYSIEKNTDNFFSSSNFADYRIYAQDGFTSKEIDDINNLDGVDKATRWLSVKVGISGKDSTIALNAVENYGISQFKVVSGLDYDKESNGIWLSDMFASANDLKLNDTIQIVYSKKSVDVEIVGLIKSAEYMVCVDENQLMPKYEDYGFGYVSPKIVKEKFGLEFYNQVVIKSNLDKKEIEQKITDTLSKTLLVLSKNENSSYMAAQSESEEGKTMGAILPVLFLLIAVLTMITTMHRITKNEKVQIGTLKALGFKDRKILIHYTSFGLMIGVLGGVLGILLGYIITAIIVSPSGMLSTYFDMPHWTLYMPWFCPLVIIGILLLLTFIGYLTVKNILKGMPAETLRPYVPKNVKKTQLEKTKIWNKMSFGFKWNYRDVVRNKSRSIVTLIGVVGCVILIVGSMGMGDSMNGFMNILNNNMNYTSKINLTQTATVADIDTLKEQYSADSVSQISVKYNDKSTLLEIYDVNNGLVKFVDKNNKDIQLNNDGVYICIRLADKGVKVGDMISFSPYGESKTYNVKVVGINRSLLSETITMTSQYAESLGLQFKPTTLFTTVQSDNISDSNIIASVQTKKQVIDSYDSFMQILYAMVIILIVAALVLGVVVLYNLGVMSYTERYREFATLKVVGFKDKQIAKMMVGQNIGLTVLGVVLGLPLGYGALYVLVKALASEYELKVTVKFLSYFVGFALTVGMSLIVSLLVSRKNKHINMAEALKDKE